MCLYMCIYILRVKEKKVLIFFAELSKIIIFRGISKILFLRGHLFINDPWIW